MVYYVYINVYTFNAIAMKANFPLSVTIFHISAIGSARFTSDETNSKNKRKINYIDITETA